LGLLGFAALGLAGVIVPISEPNLRMAARLIGWLMLLGGVGLNAFLWCALRNGL
jgi:hypothetical protein